MQAHDIMIPHPSVVTPPDSIAAAARIMRERHIRMLPVVDTVSSKTLVGIITEQDILVRCSHRGHDEHLCRVQDHMTREPLAWVQSDADIAEVVEKMTDLGFRRIPVVGPDRRLIGVISMADLEAHNTPTPARIGERVPEATVATCR